MRTEHKQTSIKLSKERAGRITASTVPAIMGLSPYTKPAEAMRRMVREYFGAPSEFEGNIATRHGHEYEQAALDALAAYTGTPFLPAPFIAYDFEGMKLGASPDAFVDAGEVVFLAEIKAPFSKRNDFIIAREYLDSRPDYQAQVQFQLMVADKLKTVFGVWTFKGIDAVIVDRNEEQCQQILQAIRPFWEQFVEIINDPLKAAPYLTDKTKPEIEERTDKDFIESAAKYLAAAESLKELEKYCDQLKAELLVMADGHQVKGGGLVISKSSRKGNVDYSAIPELADVDLEQYRKPETTSWSLKPEKEDKPKEAKPKAEKKTKKGDAS